VDGSGMPVIGAGVVLIRVTARLQPEHRVQDPRIGRDWRITAAIETVVSWNEAPFRGLSIGIQHGRPPLSDSSDDPNVTQECHSAHFQKPKSRKCS
jgi:hypothetical protein